MSIFKKKKIMVIVDNNDVPVDPKMRKKVKYKGKVKKTWLTFFGLIIILCKWAVIGIISILLWEYFK